MDRKQWQDMLVRKERETGLTEGFKFVYGPWSTLFGPEVAFISRMPGPAPDGADLRTVSDERGNSYVVERETTKSPITNSTCGWPSSLGETRAACSQVRPYRFGAVSGRI